MITSFSSVSFIPLQAEAAPITGFAYGIDDYDRNTVKVTGYIGELSVGEDLIIPSQIDGMTVTCVEGTFGKKGGNYGTFILPDTVETLNDLHVHGFSGTLEIPGSVKAGGDDICFYGPEKLIYNPVVTQIPVIPTL